jgi:hypothetical protein
VSYDGPADKNDDSVSVPSTLGLITILANGSTGAVVTTETGTNTSWSETTVPRLATGDSPVLTQRLYKNRLATIPSTDVDLGAIIVFSSTESTYTPITVPTLEGGTQDDLRCELEVEFTTATTPASYISGDTTVLATDSDRVFSYSFDGDLTDDLGGVALVKSGGTDLFIPSPSPVRGRAYRASVEHCEHAANQLALEITGALTVSLWIRFVAAQNAVFFTFGNGASSAAADNHLYTIAATTAGALIWSQENASGTNSADTSLPLLTAGEWVQVTYTRPTAATSVKLYLDGYLADTSGALTAPTGGTAGVLTLGGTEASVDTPVDVAALTIFDAELTAAQVLAHVNRERGI